MSALLEKLNTDLIEALKARDVARVSTLRFALSQIHNAKIAKGSELNDQEVEAELLKEAKRHRESIIAYSAGSREDLVTKEKSELGVLETYLPEPLTDEEITNFVKEAIEAVGATSPADMGKVIKAVMSSAGPKADGGRVAEITRQILGGTAS